MPYQPRVFAGVEVVALCDAVGPMGAAISRPLPELFPGGSFADGEEWILHFHCHLLRAAGGTVLVDTGIGGLDSPASGWAPVPGRLEAELAAVGVTPEDVDVVVLTHLHSDHASGAVVNGAPAFPNARYVIQQTELDWSGGGLMRDRVIRPLKDALQIVHRTAEPIPGIKVALAPGHTPGHQIVEVGDLIISGDALLHEAQLADPSIRYLYDDDQELAVKTRTALVNRATVLATGHFTNPFTPVRSGDTA
ncbi:MBL fold metallo-hydrolase [Acrocarpospora macrocephala]|uniref:MBL fold metallo-hydrolase n=1 Tax=Acrocarpospora macrocephala TaxID=150177 RepID=A0A5M3X3G5_9ACTN|nr:MBL fold metallo-hydrolase [Acrocarpospora macrocephala]GES14181.1 MBL fold metallo-hydrolase [Acrocarpospora macrocephala]